MAVVTTNLGVVTAYGDAVAAGYTGTKAEWQALMASYATVAEEAAQSASDAETAKNAAVTAKTDAETAKTDAIAAKTAAQTAQTAAETAAQDAEDSAQDAEDSAASIASSASQIAQNTSDITELTSGLSDKANTDGTYDGMTVGSAKQLLSEKYLLDEEPYLFRASGGDGSDRVEECIVGGSVAWNQLVQNGNFVDTSGWDRYQASFSMANNVATVTVESSGTGSIIRPNMHVIAGHKYLVTATLKSDGTSQVGLRADGGLDFTTITATSSNWVVLEGIATASNTTSSARIIATGYQANLTFQVKNFMSFDLTAMLGTTIVDYIYSLEQATAGAGVAWFRKYFPDDYYPYSAPTLRHVEGVSAKQIRDSDDNVTAIYPLDPSLTLRGIPKLTDGKMYFDGDKYNADGTVQRRYGIVDLGTLNYTRVAVSGGGYYFLSEIMPTLKNQGANYDLWPNLIIGGNYDKIASANIATGTTNDKTYGGYDGGAIRIKDDSYTDAATFKSAMSGVYLVYELATPTTEEATPYTALQTLDPNGTEEFVSTGIVPVGHYSKYLENLRSKIEGLPRDFSMIAPIETGTTASREYAVGKYFMLNNQFCKAKTAIASGATFTLNTNYEVTTVANELYTALH